MGTDRTREFQGPCACGKGTFDIDYCEVDHAWPTSRPIWYEARISCDACAKRFSVRQCDSDFVLVDNSEIRERERRSDIAFKRERDICRMGEVRAVAREIEKLLEAQPSVAAIYRKLHGAGLADNSIGTFRRHWAGSGHWVSEHVHAHNLEKLFKFVGKDFTAVRQELQVLEQLRARAGEPVPAVGKPIYSVQG